MFGHQDDQQTLNDQASQAMPQPAVYDNPSVANDLPVASDQTYVPAPSPTPAPTLQLTASDDLMDIKRQALSQLSPIVQHLDQTPEEKFRTTMMMIQASDDQSLVKAAYDSAQQIQDEKVKAQALLDIVNEINYFTHARSES